MTELEKLQAGLPYDYWDEEVNNRQLDAIGYCHELNAIPVTDREAREKIIRKMLGTSDEDTEFLPYFHCDCGKNIHVGKQFLANCNCTILDIAPVHIGDYVMIGPGVLISTVNHPMTPMGRRNHIGIAKPVTIGNDVWIGGNATILPGVTIGNNVVVAAGSVVTKDIPDNSLVGGVPAKVIRELENDIEE